MEVNTSNDVDAIEIFDDEQEPKELNLQFEDRPIMLLFKRLISNDNKQNTVLTNAQIIGILQKEFNIDISTLHELEVDIYLNIMKKFLKDWPEWDEFDRVVNRLKFAKAYASIKKVLDHKYKNLKEYLRVMLETTKELVDKNLKDLKAAENETPSTSKNCKDISKVVLEVQCSREQLNELFIRNPKSDMSTSVFNYTENIPQRIVLHTWSLESILNMWNVKVMINLNFLLYKRETLHILKHVLVNKKHSVNSNQSTILNRHLQAKLKKATEFNKQRVFHILDRILLQYTNNIEVYVLLDTVFTLIKSDLSHAPDSISIPSTYRQHSNKYAYVRYLSSNSIPEINDSEDIKYDLQLEESISPMHKFFIGKLDSVDSLLPPFRDWFKLECGYCKLKFMGNDLSERIKLHFEQYHRKEPDWQCTHCGNTFEMKYLTEHNWYHHC